ncbi:MAG: hypothetical protein H7X71_00970, partial [Chitinophagales bacterium]|nr:hypothetical protein [Chitinophagales bacterium]
MKQSNLHIIYPHQENNTSYQKEEVQAGVLRSLIYFDLFKYPLTIQEIIKYAPVKLNGLSPVETALASLEESFIVLRFGEFYTLRNENTLIDRRKRGNRMAADIFTKAVERSKFIYKFPFVRSVNISGSLSKNYFDEHADFDFFIITSPNRIWLCRTILALYKKIFLLNARKYFCINYFIDTEDLSIPDKNIFAATEVITLKNMAGREVYTAFMD